MYLNLYLDCMNVHWKKLNLYCKLADLIEWVKLLDPMQICAEDVAHIAHSG